MAGGEAARTRAVRERLSAAGIGDASASALASVASMGAGAAEALSALLDALDARCSEVAEREAENARLADENAG